MRLKKLEIQGFKSFADRARFNFGDGITGVVGPNGCGKSNVVDSIRWCMGEMSAKHLRGRAMQDVIFAGSDSRGPMGMAEVTLTFSNDGDMPPAYGSYSDIAVTRRLHRDGSSEYLINKVPVRLRDITDLFLGTGVGTRAYSIIEQGRIGFVVNSRPEDRRSLIEEVAGITKFKARKKAAERRMEATEQNLARVQDIVAELERQLGSLRRQAKKAERYKEVRAELRDLDLHMASLEILRLAGAQKVKEAERADIESMIGDSQRGLVAQESSLEADRLRLLEEEKELQRQQALSAELDARLAALERDLEHWRRQLVEARQRVETSTADVDDARARIAAGERERESLVDQVATYEEAVHFERGKMAEAQARVEALQDDLGAVDEELEVLRRNAMEHAQGAIKQRAMVGHLERQRLDLMNRIERARAEQEDLTVRLGAAVERRRDLGERRERVEQDLERWTETIGVLRGQLREVSKEVADSDAAVIALRDTLSDRRSRLGSLQEIVRRLEGYSDGVRTLLGARPGGGGASDEPVVDGIRGLVAEILDVPSEHEQAIEAVLAERLQYLVVDDQQVAVNAIEHLRTAGGGRGGFIPATPRVDGLEMGAVATGDGVLGAAIDLVRVQPQERALAQALLSGVVLVDDMAAAQRAWRSDATPGRVWVTRDGAVLASTGVMTGGTDEGAGLLATRREIRELEEAVAGLTEQLAAARAHHESLEQHRLQVEVDLQQLDKDIRAAELEKLEFGKDFESVGREVERMEERLDVLQSDLDGWSQDLTAAHAEEAAARQAAEESEAGREDVEWRLAELQERRQVHASQLGAEGDALTALKVHMAAREEKQQSARDGIERLTRGLAELEGRIAKGEASIEEATFAVTDLSERIQQGQAEASERVEEAQTRRLALSEARATYEAERVRIADEERAIREQRKGGESLSERLMQVKLDLERLQMERQKVVDHVAERHDLDLLGIVGDYHMRPPPGDEAHKRKVELERSIKNMGPINLQAIEECAEVEQRYCFLAGQRDDLVGALDSLKKAISRINRASRERFREAFESVNEMFQKVYPRLFRGGVARLELTNSDDMLEAGVDIIAQPPGKKLQNVGLLSGGEKALTATALVFSIFLIKPSPFCILDEVDAPLDEANVGRFNEMLREISKFSQFIVITHNKASMQMADRLYGVTMEDPGMSKVVSVDVQGLEEDEVQAA